MTKKILLYMSDRAFLSSWRHNPLKDRWEKEIPASNVEEGDEDEYLLEEIIEDVISGNWGWEVKED